MRCCSPPCCPRRRPHAPSRGRAAAPAGSVRLRRLHRMMRGVGRSAMTRPRAAASPIDPGLAPHLAQRLLSKPGLTVRSTLDRRAQIDRRARARAASCSGLGARPRARRRGDRRRQCDRRGARLCRRGRRRLDRRAGRRRRRLSPGRIDAEALPLRAGDRARLSHPRLDPRRFSPVQLDTASGLYVPQNYDRGFKGPVSVRAALAGLAQRPRGARAAARSGSSSSATGCGTSAIAA